MENLTLSGHFRLSWERMKSALLAFFVASVVYTGAILLTAIVSGILLFVLIMIHIPTIQKIKVLDDPWKIIQAIPTGMWWSFGLVFFVLIILSYLIGLLLSAFEIGIVSKDKKNASMGRIFHALPMLFLGSMVIVFLLIGSFALFFIPGILMLLFLMFWACEVVIKQTSFWKGLTRSVHLVTKHFPLVAGRYLLIILLSWGISFLFNALYSYAGDATILVAIISIIIQLVIGWYAIAYMVVLYEYVDEHTDKDGKTPVWWMFLIASFGWLMLFVVGYAIVQISVPAIQKEIKQNTAQKIAKEKPTFDVYVPSQCGVSIPIPDTRDDKGRLWIYEDIPPLEWSSVWSLITKEEAPKGVLSGAMSFKTENDRYKENETSFKPYSGILIYCGNNVQNLTLDNFVSRATKTNTLQTIIEKTGGKQKWGELQVQGIYVTGIKDGARYKEPFYLGVTKNGSQLVIFKLWNVNQKDPSANAFGFDQSAILDNLKADR